MKGVSCAHLTRGKDGERSQDICDPPVLVRAMCRRDQFDRSKARCDYDEPAAMLRNTVILTVDHPFLRVVSEMETFVGENCQEVTEDFVALELGYVLHTHDVGLQLSDQTAEVSEQRPFRITEILEPLGIFRKRLAGCTPDKNLCVAFRVLTGQVASGEFGYAFFMKRRSRIVVFVRKPTHLIGVVTGDNVHARVQ